MPDSADPHVLSRAQFDAAIFDLDGVITRTARLHARAWKQMFDAFLAERDAPPFDIERDYRAHVDGKPRLDGVRDFLAARGIELPRGAEDDAPGTRTLWSLANRKNALFHELLEREGAEVFESSIELVKALRAAGFGTAVVSSSRNCLPILESVGAIALFDVKVDGVEAAERGLAGKPAPDIFVAAARSLGVAPARAVVFEDALAGVEAGRAGGFGRVIGVDRAGQADALREHGAQLVVADLGELSVEPPARAPSALERIDEIAARLRGRRVALFLDYDGTLTPIVERPEAATLGTEMRAALARIAARCVLAVVSGRDLADVRERVALEGPGYAGSHGFDILGPAGERQVLPEAEDAVPALDAAERALRKAIGGIEGAQLERKRFSIAVHTRRAREADVPAIERAVDAALQAHAGLRKRRGKKVLELQPDVDWDKGAAVRWLLDALGLDEAGALPVYVGDDLTDEDAFRAIAGRGIGIVVLDAPRASAASYALRDPDEVRAFIDALAGVLERAA
ncbi:MAG: trehalose-phosphatase [Burkholderiales bacterium]|nr:trehalose-phosphatase [Burkholderiales bacterium]